LVSVYNVGAAEGRLGFDWGSLPQLRQGAYVVDPTLLDYKFQVSYGPSQVAASTWNILPMGGAVAIRLADGRSAVVAASSGNATLSVVITGDGAAIPTLSPILVVVLALLLSIAAGAILYAVREPSDGQRLM
jgi:hypothetical protein